MPNETINWRTTRVLPKVDTKNRLDFTSSMAKIPDSVGKPFHPVLFMTGTEVVAGRFFPREVLGYRWWSVQGAPFFDEEISYWAEIPNGPKPRASHG